MRRKLGIAALVVGLAGMGISPAFAAKGGGGNGSPSGAPPNAHGLCTAAANGQKNGQPWQNGTPGPFQKLESSYLESAANESSSDTEGTRADFNQDCNDAGVPVGGQGK